MIAAWTFCVLAVGAVLLVVGVSGELLAAHLRWPRRVVWCVVMVAMCGLPAALRVVPAPLPLLPAAAAVTRLPSQLAATERVVTQVSQRLQATSPPMMLRVTQGAANTVIVEPESMLLRADWLLAALLLTGTLAALLFVLAAALRMRRMRQQWTIADDATVTAVSAAAGRRVQVWRSQDVGPAAFGVRHPQVVLPQWVDTLDDGARALLIAHEASHIAARDPLLLRVALTMVVLMPWNLPLLLAYRRLHRAVEHDCDRRVLLTSGDARIYGRLLLATAERIVGMNGAPSWSRVSRWLPAPVAGIGLRRSELELRLRALMRPVTTWRTRGRAVAAGGTLVAAVLVACSVPSPAGEKRAAPVAIPLMQSAVTIRASDPASTGGKPSALDSLAAFEEIFLPMFNRTQSLRDSIVEAAARKTLPAVFAPGSNETHIWLLVDDRYSVIRFTTGRQFHLVREADAGPVRPVADFPATPRNRLATASESFVAAFPGVTVANLNARQSEVAVKLGTRDVSIFWARYVPTQATTPPSPTATTGRTTASAFTLGITGQGRQADGAAGTRNGTVADSLAAQKAIAIPVSVNSRAERDSVVIAAARFVHPRVFTAASPETHIWLVVDERFAVLRSTTGVSVPSAPKNIASMTEFYLKSFPELDPRYLTNSHTQTDVRVGRRTVSIFWALYPQELLRRKA